MAQQTYTPLTTPYEVDSIPFPSSGSFADQCLHLLRYAILAPSVRNTQPWKFRLTDEGIAVFADYTRRLPVADPDNRELLMSVGAAITNLRIAAEHFGFATEVEYNTGSDSELPVAFVKLGPRGVSRASTSRAESLFPMIAKRHTNRRTFLMARVPEAILGRLTAAGQQQDVGVLFSTDPTKNAQVALLVAEAERRLQENPEYRKEFSEWLRPNSARMTDGMPGAAIGIGDVPSALAPWATKVLNLGPLYAQRDKRLCIEAPALCVLYSEEAAQLWISVGEKLQLLLLTIVREGLQYSFFTMPIELHDTRTALRELFALHAWPQLLLRIGYSFEQPVPTPRRPVEECVIS